MSERPVLPQKFLRPALQTETFAEVGYAMISAMLKSHATVNSHPIRAVDGFCDWIQPYVIWR